jgi:hypothetical protein
MLFSRVVISDILGTRIPALPAARKDPGIVYRKAKATPKDGQCVSLLPCFNRYRRGGQVEY